MCVVVLCVCVYICSVCYACACVCSSMHAWRPEVDLGYLPVLFFPLFLRQFLPLAHQFGWTGWLAVTQDSPVSTHTALGVQACATAADFLFEC